MGKEYVAAWEIPAGSVEGEYRGEYRVGCQHYRVWVVGSIEVRDDRVLVFDEKGRKRVSLPLAMTGLEWEGPLP
jgi:hypothetical protein